MSRKPLRLEALAENWAEKLQQTIQGWPPEIGPQLQFWLRQQRTFLLRALACSLDNLRQELLELSQNEALMLTLSGCENLLSELQDIQSRILSLRKRFQDMLEQLPFPPTEAGQARLKRFWQSQTLLWDSLQINNESAFQLAKTSCSRWSAELPACQELCPTEKIALLHLHQALLETLQLYFLLRSLLSQRQRRLKSRQPLPQGDLRVLHLYQKGQAGSSLVQGTEPELAWRLQLNTDPPQVINALGVSLQHLGRSYQYYLKTGFYWLELTASQNFQSPENLILAAEAFYKALSVHAGSVESYWALSCILFLLDCPDQALNLLERAVALEPNPGLRHLQEVLERYVHA